ncbi:MAG: hypothetical protein JWO40_854 [Candidatus Doudnabacteria bacterium]|nr:hypothetical protein [Candidatus Doudnabacteria bacterium]
MDSLVFTKGNDMLDEQTTPAAEPAKTETPTEDHAKQVGAKTEDNAA